MRRIFPFTIRNSPSFIHNFSSPVPGRFVSPDTIVPEPGSSGGFNRYRYARNNPLRYRDPSGQEPCDNGNWGDCPPPKSSETVPPIDSSPSNNETSFTNEFAANYFTGWALALDTGTMILNGVSAGITDVATIIAGPPGYGFGVAVHNGVVSPIATGLDGLALLSTITAGVFTGENAMIFELNEHGGALLSKSLKIP